MQSILRMNTIYLIFIYETYKLYVNDITYYETKYVFQTRKLRKRDIQCCSNVKYHVTVFVIVKMCMAIFLSLPIHYVQFLVSMRMRQFITWYFLRHTRNPSEKKEKKKSASKSHTKSQSAFGASKSL